MPRSRRSCAPANADPDELARELEDYLGLLSPEKLDVSQVQRALEGAALVAMRAGRTQMSTQSVLVQIRRDPDAYASLLLRAAGIELVDLLRCVSHGKPDVRPHALTGVTRAALRMHNDDFTTMEFVVHVLHSFFGMNEVEAKQRMLQIHSEGSVVVGDPTSMEDALGRAVRIFDEAERAGVPAALLARSGLAKAFRSRRAARACRVACRPPCRSWSRAARRPPSYANACAIRGR